MMFLFRRLLGDFALIALNLPFVDRAVAFLAWQRRRKTRRRVETRLADRNVYPDQVQLGPFSGMILPDRQTYVDSRFEKVFGAYEHDLFPLLEVLSSDPGRFQEVVNVGAADGFYTVGLARMLPDAAVLAFEPNSDRAEVLKETARLNDVADRIRLRGCCTLEELRTHLPLGETLVVIDVDGQEESLLVPEEVPWFSRASFLVETHEFFVPGVIELLRRRFEPTHEIFEIMMSAPVYETIPLLRELAMHEVDSMVGSERPNLQTWLWMEPRTGWDLFPESNPRPHPSPSSPQSKP